MRTCHSNMPLWHKNYFVCVCVLKCAQFFATPWTVALQATLSMGFPRQEYLSGLPFPYPGDLPTQGLNPCLLCLLHRQVDSLLLSHLGSPGYLWCPPKCCFLLSIHRSVELLRSSPLEGKMILFWWSDSLVSSVLGSEANVGLREAFPTLWLNMKKYFSMCTCMGFSGGASGKESTYNAGDARDSGSIPGQENPLEKEMATHSSILAWEIPWTE